MEAILRKLIEQNDRLIEIGEQTVGALSSLQETISSGLSEVHTQLLLNDSSSDVASIETEVRNVLSSLDGVLQELRERE